MQTTPRRASRLLVSTLALGIAAACGQAAPENSAPAQEQAAPAAAAEPARVEHAFRGTVEAVDPTAKTLRVMNENIEGWMGPMSMVYSADKDDVYTTVKAGDQITATVYDGDFKTLYNVQVVPGGGAAAQP